MTAETGIEYRRRLGDTLLDRLLVEIAAVLVVGPRAIGKTTTVGRRATTTVHLDREAEAAAFAADPDAALRGLPEPVLLDEWQHVPGVLGAIRRAVDADPHPNRFFVTGSVRAELENAVWPGTGRLVRWAMYPMTVREQIGRAEGLTFFDRVANRDELIVPADAPDLRGYVELAFRGGFPVPALLLTGSTRQEWLESYVENLLTHDVEQLDEPATRRRDTQRLRRYLEAYALSSGGVPDHKTIYDAAQIERRTALAYDALLSGLLIVEQLPAWTSNRLKRLVHQPKRYLVDAALIPTVLRIDENGVMRDGDLLGRMLDTFVTAQLRPELAISATRPRLHHLRTAQGRHEIDLVAELAGDRLIGIEIRSSAAPGRDEGRHLRWLRDELGERFLAGILFHTGPRVYALDDRITAAPIATLWG
jgi:predicted AAA+ superfamily ATPase